MKHNIIKTMAALAVCGGLASCSDFLDQSSPSSLDDTNIYASYDLAKGTIINIYNYYGEQNYRARHIWYGYNTDAEWYNNSDKNGDGKADLAVYDVYPNNNQMNNSDGKEPWSNIYSGVERANLAIQGLSTYANLSDPQMANLYGEALTLRALAYLDLVNCWGDVPARWEPITSETITMARTSKEEIYAHLIADLAEAEKYSALPNALDETTTVERVNKVFVKGLRARIALQAAGYSLHNIDGNPVNKLNDIPDYTRKALYKIAYEECTDILKNYGSYYKLSSDFQQIFVDLCQDVISNGRESMFEIGYANDPSARGRQVYTFGIYHEVADGMVGAKGQGGQVGPVPTLYFDYDKSDTRRDVTCCPYSWGTKGTQELGKLNKWYFGKLRYEWMARSISSTDDGVNQVMMRYSDIYLMAAEAANELDKLSEAQGYLKSVMDKRYSDASVVTAKLAAASDKGSLFNLIVDERKLEFAGEFFRKADLIRWGMLSKKLKAEQNKMRDLRELAGDYSYLTGRVYYKMDTYSFTNTVNSARSWNIANAKLSLWGLSAGETDGNVPSGYTENTNSDGNPSKWINYSEKEDGSISTTLEDDKINALFDSDHDPDEYMYWPIFNVNLNDNTALQNYPWYNK